jgi:hypothetical protein
VKLFHIFEELFVKLFFVKNFFVKNVFVNNFFIFTLFCIGFALDGAAFGYSRFSRADPPIIKTVRPAGCGREGT